ncbi:MAG TPA: ATP-binding protein [Steroidobacteraceae bacterium]|nr:ATP-binding protein [Steroidobacteraceae bacterium]
MVAAPHHERPQPAAPALARRPDPRTVPFVLLLLAVIAALFGGGAWLYQREAERIRAEKVEEIASIAALKVGQLATWRDERLMDARFGAVGPFLVGAMEQWERGRVDSAQRAAYESRLVNYISMLRYDHAALIAPDGRVAYASGNGPHALAPAENVAVREARARRDAVLSEFFRVPGGGVRISVVAPVFYAGRQIGTVLLRRDPEHTLFPMLLRWPTPSPSAEIVLVTREGDSMLLIAGLLRRGVRPMSMRVPLSNDALPGVRAFRSNRPVTVEGRDYSGVDLIVRAEPVPGTRWVLGAIVERAEVLAEARYRGLAILGFALLGTLLSATAVMLVFGRRQRRLDRELLEAERERSRALEDAETMRLRLRGVIDATSDLIAAIDRDFRYIAFNKAYADDFRRIFGPDIAPGDSMLEKLAHLPTEQSNARAVWGRALRGEQYTILHAFGDVERERRTFELAFSPMRDAAGEVIGAVHALRDVSERVRTVQALAASEARLRQLNDDLERLVAERTRELVEARDQAESSNRIKDVFLATMSHELRTPLNSIIGFSEIMLGGIVGELNAEQRTQLGIIHKSGQQLLALISDVLDISKIEAGQLRLDITAVPLHEILHEQHHVFELQARERGLAIRFDCPAQPVWVLADAQRLRQVIGNLLSNAVKFTDRGEVGIGAELRDHEVCITVYDTGIGIGPTELADLFKPFRRVAPKHGGNRDGTGLGLAISRRLVEAMGGEIGVTSEPGLGSRFWFTLPQAA